MSSTTGPAKYRIRESGLFYFAEELQGSEWIPVSIPSSNIDTIRERLQSVIQKREAGDTIVAEFDAGGEEL